MGTPKAIGRAQHDRSAADRDAIAGRARAPIRAMREPARSAEIRRIAIASRAPAIFSRSWSTKMDVDPRRAWAACGSEAARLGHVPTIKAVGLTDAQKRLFAIADNKLTENAGWTATFCKGVRRARGAARAGGS